jgi:hypothetical protein
MREQRTKEPLAKAIAELSDRPVIQVTREEIARVCNGKASLQEGNKVWRYIQQIEEALAWVQYKKDQP